jgi:hypothetical protein
MSLVSRAARNRIFCIAFRAAHRQISAVTKQRSNYENQTFSFA